MCIRDRFLVIKKPSYSRILYRWVAVMLRINRKVKKTAPFTPENNFWTAKVDINEYKSNRMTEYPTLLKLIKPAMASSLLSLSVLITHR